VNDFVKDTLTKIIQETCEPFPPADHIVKRLMDELPEHGLAVVGMGAKAPRPTPPDEHVCTVAYCCD
jgi:hypothetical protein